MAEAFRHWMDLIGTAVDGVGVLVIVGGIVLASARMFWREAPDGETRFTVYRQDVGRAILLGLEFLVAGDIIRTVVVAPTMDNVLVLAVIVAIRTFLSMSLQVELEGRWPWQKATRTRAAGGHSEQGR